MPNKNKSLGTSLERRVVERSQSKGMRSRRQPLSGVLKDFPNDVAIENVLAECKVRSARLNAKGAKCITFEMDWLDGVLKNAERAGFDFGTVLFSPKGSQSIYAVVPLDVLLGAILASKALDGGGGLPV